MRPITATSGKERDIRLDVFRGFALFVIFVAHMPMNPLAHVTPGRFGFSDSAEIFVFCSGIAAALAFGPLFQRAGFLAGTARVGLRVWQLYWAHIAIFMLVLATNALFDRWAGGGTRYLDGFNLTNFFREGGPQNVIGLMTLTYVPNYFDILVMYIVLLVLVPFVLFFERIGLWAVAAFVMALWVIAEAGHLELPAEPWSDRTWYFNPFSWQLVFFTGFAFARGWLPAPKRDRWLLLLASAILAVSFVFSFQPLVSRLGLSAHVTEGLRQLTEKTHLGILRYVHFLALAYVAYVLAGEAGRKLRGPFAELCRVAGSQALAVFLAGLWLSVVAGYVLHQVGGSIPAAIVVNALGIAVLVLVAVVADWFKSEPWRRPAIARVETVQPSLHALGFDPAEVTSGRRPR